MKIFIHTLALFALVIANACTEYTCTDMPDVIVDPYEWAFQFNEDGTLKTFPCKIFESADELQATLVGNCWKHSSSYKIAEDGLPEKKEFYSDIYGISPMHYYFETADRMSVLFYSDAEAGRLVKRSHEWRYSEKETFIYIATEPTTIEHVNVIQIIGKDQDMIWLTQLVSYNVEDGKDKPVYVVSRYDRMTDNELKEFLAEAGE